MHVGMSTTHVTFEAEAATTTPLPHETLRC